MRSAAVGACLFALGCGGSTTSGPTTAPAEDASLDGASEASEDAPATADAQDDDASCATILASSYDQTCAADTDCVSVGEGNVCTTPCSFVCGFGATINAAAVPAYRTDLSRTGFSTTGIGCGCVAYSYGPCCVGGLCQQGPMCLSTSTANPDAGPDGAADAGPCPSGEALCLVGCDGAVECQVLPCPAIPPCLPP